MRGSAPIGRGTPETRGAHPYKPRSGLRGELAATPNTSRLTRRGTTIARGGGRIDLKGLRQTAARAGKESSP